MMPEIKQRIEQIRRGEVPEGYVKTALGLAPANWKRYTFGDIYTERKEPGDENLPLLMVSIHSGVSDGEVDAAELPKQVKRIEDKSQYKKAVSGDLVFNMMQAWQGAIGTVRTTGMVSPAYIVAEANDKVYPLFMDYYSRTPQMINQIDRQSYGVTDFRKRLYWDSFAPIGCILPPIAKQQKIAAILTTQDKVIELKEKRLAEKQRQKKYLMQQLLTGKKRLPGFNGTWEKEKLGYICDIVKGEQVNKNSLYEVGKYYVLNGGVTPSGYTDTWNTSENTISISEGGNSCGFVNFNREKFWSSGHCYTLNSLNSSKIVNTFLYQYLKHHEYEIKSLRVGSGLPNIQKTALDNFGLTCPPIEEQTSIAEVLSAADREIELLQQDIEQEKQKKKALMQLLLTGIVRVKT